LFNKKHLDRTHAFFEKYGGKTIIIARFVPIVRTFAPFVAGVGAMTYRRFLVYNVVGGVAWVTGFLLAGYWFGNIPWVKQNFSAVILAIIFVSVLPMFFEYFRQAAAAKASGRKSAAGQEGRPAVGQHGGVGEPRRTTVGEFSGVGEPRPTAGDPVAPIESTELG
jgi:membrane protein DedA with SNARE-associated domain